MPSETVFWISISTENVANKRIVDETGNRIKKILKIYRKKIA